MKEDPLVPAAGAAEETEEVVAARAREVLEEFERKRSYRGLPALLISIVAVTTSCYHLAYAYLHPFFALDHRVLHWLFMSVMLFALFPFSKKRSPLTRMSLIDGVLLIVSAAICVWIFIHSTSILKRAGTFGTLDVAMGTAMVLIVLDEAKAF
jgi:TRAP-type uncharacterized transport system fused permease subunit